MAEADDPGLPRAEQQFAQQVRQLRDELGWSQAQLADRMQGVGLGHVNQMTVSRIESGTRPVRLSEALALSAIFNRTLISMTDPDSREAVVHLFEPSARAGHQAIQALRQAVRKVVEAQQRAAGDREFIEDMLKSGPLTDPDALQRLDALMADLSRIESFDPVWATYEIVVPPEQRKRDWRVELERGDIVDHVQLSKKDETERD